MIFGSCHMKAIKPDTTIEVRQAVKKDVKNISKKIIENCKEKG